MDISTLKHFLTMGGYAFYVWTAYGVAFVVLVTNLILPLVRQRRLLRALTLAKTPAKLE